MTQTRIHDYHAPRSTADLNHKFVGLLPPGVYQGFHVAKDGTLAPGVLLTAEGVRIEETVEQRLTLTPNASALPRRDLVVCEHEYQATLPNPDARFRVIVGEATDTAPLPTLPEHATLIAVCHMAAGSSSWDAIEQNAVAPELLLNAKRDGWQYRIVAGGSAALRVSVGLEAGGGRVSCYLHSRAGLADGAEITWGEPVFSFSDTGTAASIIKMADNAGRFSATDVEAALAELAGANRTT